MNTRLAAIAACCVAASAHAADNGFYLGAGVGRSDFNISTALENTDTGMKLLAGTRLLDSFGVEINYADLGKASVPAGGICTALAGAACPGTSSVTAKTTAAYAVGFIDFPVLDLFAKAGLAHARGKLTSPGTPTFRHSEKDTDVALGLGVQAHFASLGGRVEMEQFKLYGEKLRVISASFVYTIL